MELEHHFEVPVGVDEAWSHLLNMAEVADCFPGATLASADGEEYTGSVKVKLGPIQLTYKGSARIAEADETAHRAVITASGKAARSGSTADMTVTATAGEIADDRTEVTMKTDLTITGKPAQFGRGVMADVGDKILGKFADCIAGKLAAGAGPAGDDADPASDTGSHGTATDAPANDGTTTAGESAVAASAAASPSTAKQAGASYSRVPDSDHGPVGSDSVGIDHAGGTNEPIDLLDSAGLPVAKRLAPVAGGALVLLLVIWLLRRRRD